MVRFVVSNLGRIRSTCFSTVRGLMCKAIPISRLVWPLVSHKSISRSRRIRDDRTRLRNEPAALIPRLEEGRSSGEPSLIVIGRGRLIFPKSAADGEFAPCVLPRTPALLKACLGSRLGPPSPDSPRPILPRYPRHAFQSSVGAPPK